MQTLLLSLSLGLVAALRAQDPLAFPEEEPDISGTWYMKYVVGDKAFREDKMLTPVSPITVSVLSGGDVNVSFSFLKNGECQEINTVLEKTAVPGKYSAYGGMSHLYVKGLPWKDHCIFYSEGEFQGERFRVGKLMGRNLVVNVEALEEFKEFMKQGGFLLENIFSPPHMENCASSRG